MPNKAQEQSKQILTLFRGNQQYALWQSSRVDRPTKNPLVLSTGRDRVDGKLCKRFLSSLQSSLSLEQQDAIDKADLMCETALKLLKTVHRRDEALKNALDGLQTHIDVFGQNHIDVTRSEIQSPVVI